MNIQEINKIYKQMGLGSEKERNYFIELGQKINCEDNKNDQLFILNSPTSKIKKVEKNAKLA